MDFLHGFEIFDTPSLFPNPVSVCWLPARPTCRHTYGFVHCHNKGVRPSEVAIQKVAEVVNVVVRREYACVELLALHMAPQSIQSSLHLLR